MGTPAGSNSERSVTAAYTVPPGRFLQSFDDVIMRGVGLGGYVVSSHTRSNPSGRIAGGTVTLKVPSPRIADFLNDAPSDFTA